MRDPASFTDDENWHGGFDELAVELGDTDDQQLQLALTALWKAAGIDGCYGRRDREPGEQREVARTVASLAEFGHLRGTVLLPNGHRVVCGCFAVREDDGPDWLDFPRRPPGRLPPPRHPLRREKAEPPGPPGDSADVVDGCARTSYFGSSSPALAMSCCSSAG